VRKDTVRSRAARASCLPALGPAREVLRCDRTGGACGYVRSSMPPFGKPGPKLSPRDESPFGENRRGTPAGERARKRGAAQAAFLRGAYRTPLACGHDQLASAGVPLPFYLRMIFSENRDCTFRDHALSRKRVEKRRFVDETASTAHSEIASWLDRGVGKTRARKNAPRERIISC